MKVLRRSLVGIFMLLALGAVGLVVHSFLPPAQPFVATAFAPGQMGDDIDAYLATREAQFADITDGVEKKIIWAGAPGERTELALVYVHGFSATSAELRPVPDRVAEALGANLHFTRLTGHGQGGAALGAATAQDWADDLAEALAVGQALGERVVLMGTSTGGTLAATAALTPGFSGMVDALVLISPNFGLQGQEARLLDVPFREWIVPLLVGDERGFMPFNEEHDRFWTTRYPVRALFAMRDLQRWSARLDHAQATVPALFIWSDEDRIVNPEVTRRIAARWGAPAEAVTLKLGPGDDPAHHVLAGDILSPSQNERVTEIITGWVDAH